MADVRCPMCGKTTPADLDECQHCQARLRPIWESSPPGDSAESPGDQTSDLPDWLKSLRSPDDQEAEQSASEPEGRSALPDWLGELRKQPGEEGSSRPEEISEEPASRSDDSDASWLQDFLAEDDLTEGALPSGQLNDAFQPDDAGWLSRIGSTPVEEQPQQQSLDTPDWLNELEQAAPDLSPSGEQGWFSQSETPPLESAEPLPDWLTKADANLPEWLAQEVAPIAAEPEGVLEPELFEELSAEEELPGWLQHAPDSIQEPAEPVDASMSEWTKLEPLENAVPEPVGDEAVNWLADGEEKLPDWLFSESSPVEPSDLAETPTPQSAEELAPAGLFSEEPLISELQTPEVEGPETPAEEASPWLADAKVEAAGLGFPLGGEQTGDDLGWLDELEATYSGLSPNVPEEATGSPGEAESLGLEPGTALPGWLTKASEEDAQALEGGAEGETELKPAELPSWLQAMRPVGVMAAAASLTGEPEQQQIEGAGPLAGLRGALPAEPDVSQVQKPPVYSVKLQVTETQQVQADLLRSLIDAEGQPKVLPGRPAISSQDVIRVFIAVLLIFPLLFVLLTGLPQFGLPASSLEVEAVGKMIDGLPSGVPVLLAVDYQPGFSGEMDAVAAPVVQHVFERGAYLALVSTISTGPVQAEHLLAKVRSSSGAPLQFLANTTNLGYIPGGATGLLAFARSPRTVLPTNLGGERAWEAAGLQGVDTLAKFALVIVATENPDVARYWIEQVQPQLGATPLVMVLSAQAEPVIWPYYHASPSQVQGLVGGLAGGAAYLARSAQSGSATQFWSPYNLGIAIAVGLMILGGILHLISARIARQKEKAGGERRP